jgi:antibiotic biosynthesis monooxygenase (ABM) superfamily enzyme
MTMDTASPPTTVTLVTQTRILPGHSDEFEVWQKRIDSVIANAPGFIDVALLPPTPPIQLDWVIMQRFSTMEAARGWLQSPEREALLHEIQPALVGPVDIHLFSGNDPRLPNAPVSIVISTKVKPGQEDAFKQWQRRAAVAQAKFEGFQGYKLEPPISGVQEDWVTVLRFDSDAHLEAWLTSEQRLRLLDDTAGFNVETHARKVHSGFESWFPSGEGGEPPPPVWKQNMIVLMILFPLAYLLGKWVWTPLLLDRGVSSSLALFAANSVNVFLLGYLLVPHVNTLLTWWLYPASERKQTRNLAGTALVLAVYGVCLIGAVLYG